MIRRPLMEQATFYATLRLLSNHDGIPKCPFYKAEHGQNGGQTVMLRRYYNTSCHGLQTQPHFRLIGRQLGPDHSGGTRPLWSLRERLFYDTLVV